MDQRPCSTHGESIEARDSIPTQEHIARLLGTLPDFPTAIGSIDMTIHEMRMPHTNEQTFYRYDKDTHLFNTLTLVDFTGSFLHVEPAFAGRMADRTAYQLSELYQYLDDANVDVLADRGFTGEDHCITPNEQQAASQMADRARQECVYHELHSVALCTYHLFRHRRAIHAGMILLSCQLFNFRKRVRLANALSRANEFVEMEDLVQ
eukprot:TRINITY_DN1496_c0_g2_i4.p1 TRINITY_DN1496_c0_g2~~TRINITY_DN1496_c0_g2_i4.p1  ORF type:complete len:207 (-),score=17.60 TRINITY_DN1496_c0_g2_i4:23-643(-)